VLCFSFVNQIGLDQGLVHTHTHTFLWGYTPVRITGVLVMLSLYYAFFNPEIFLFTCKSFILYPRPLRRWK